MNPSLQHNQETCVQDEFMVMGAIARHTITTAFNVLGLSLVLVHTFHYTSHK